MGIQVSHIIRKPYDAACGQMVSAYGECCYKPSYSHYNCYFLSFFIGRELVNKIMQVSVTRF